MCRFSACRRTQDKKTVLAPAKALFLLKENIEKQKDIKGGNLSAAAVGPKTYCYLTTYTLLLSC